MIYDEDVINKILLTIKNLVSGSWEKTTNYTDLIEKLDKSITSKHDVFEYLRYLHVSQYIEFQKKHSFFTIKLLPKVEQKILSITLPKRDFDYYKKQKREIEKDLYFLSHSSNDKEFVNKLAIDLKRSGLQIFFDTLNIGVGESIPDKISKAYDSMKGFILILSPSSVESKWVKMELDNAIMKKVSENSVEIFPVLYKSCNIPSIIKSIKYADFRSNYQNGLMELINNIRSTLS